MSEIKGQFGHPRPVVSNGASGAGKGGVLRILEEGADKLSQSVVQSMVSNYAASHRISEATARTSLILLGLGTATRLEEDAARAARDKQAIKSALDGMTRAIGGGMRAANETNRLLSTDLSSLFMQQVVAGLK
jgi:hypothetical protein